MSMKDELTQYLYNFCCIRYDQLRAMKTLDAKKSTEYHMAAPWKIAVGCLIAWVVIFGIVELIFGKGYGPESSIGLAFLTAIFIIFTLIITIIMGCFNFIFSSHFISPYSLFNL